LSLPHLKRDEQAFRRLCATMLSHHTMTHAASAIVTAKPDRPSAGSDARPARQSGDREPRCPVWTLLR